MMDEAAALIWDNPCLSALHSQGTPIQEKARRVPDQRCGDERVLVVAGRKPGV
jgi:hypothetical protein